MTKITNTEKTKEELRALGYLTDLQPDDKVICKEEVHKYMGHLGVHRERIAPHRYENTITFKGQWFVEDDYIVSMDGRCKMILGEEVEKNKFVIVFKLDRVRETDLFRINWKDRNRALGF